MTRQTDDALVPSGCWSHAICWNLRSRGPVGLQGLVVGQAARVIKHYVDWCLQDDLPPLPRRAGTSNCRCAGAAVGMIDGHGIHHPAQAAQPQRHARPGCLAP